MANIEEVAEILEAVDAATASPDPAAPEVAKVTFRRMDEWRYRAPFEPSQSPDPMARIAAAFESIATSLQDLSYAQNILAADAVYKTERQF